MAGVIEELGAPRGLKTLMISGGRAFGPQRDELRRGVHVVVGTPGRVLDLLNQGAIWLDRVRFLVLDEADEMLDRGFAPDVERIIARTTPDRQTALFSATVPSWVKQTASKHLHDPETVTIVPEPGEVAQIEHLAFEIGGDKMQVLQDLLDHRGDGSVIVFGRTKHGVNKLARRLQADGYPVAALQGNLSQNARDRVMDDFRNGQVPVLVATNVAARGLDVTHVAQVINIELPESPELLTHRVGRTGRMGRQGQAITLLGPEDMHQVAAAGARVHPPHQTRPLAGCEGAAGQRQWSRGIARGRQCRWQPVLWPRCAKRHVLPHDAPRRPAPGSSATSRVGSPPRAGDWPATARDRRYGTRAGGPRVAAPLWSRSAPPGLGGRRAWRRIRRHVTGRGNW